MPALSAIWLIAKGLPWKWIGLGLAVLAIVLFIDHHGYNRGKADTVAKYQPVMDRALANIRTLKSNQLALTAAIARQNAAVAALKADSNARVADGVKALRDAQRANAGLIEKADALHKSAGRTVAKDAPCVVSDMLARTGAI